MKVIIAGGRDYEPTIEDNNILWRFINDDKITEIVSGGCSGADMFGEYIAEQARITVKRFPADWSKYGKAAGPIRNEAMAKYADAIILFPGGRGTDNMRKMAKRYGKTILYDADKNSPLHK